MDVDNTPHSLLWMKVPPHGSPSPRPPLHPSSSSLHLNIIDAIKLIKFRSWCKSDLTTIDFDSIDVHGDKDLLTSFDSDILFVLSPLSMRIPSTYDHSICSMDKMCDGHPWCTTKNTNI